MSRPTHEHSGGDGTTGRTPAARLYIPSLDGLRAVSIVIVFLGHAGAGEIIPGGFGVTVFFVVSGYLITTLMRLEFERTDAMSIRDFYTRRVFRILPLFYVVLAVILALTLTVGLGRGEADGWATFAQFAHVSNYWTIIQSSLDLGRPVMLGTGVYWSLAVEEHFYLGFPLLFVALNSRRVSYRNQAWVLAAICLVVLVWRSVLVFALDAPEFRTYYATDTRLDSILIGCIVAMIANPVLDAMPSQRVLFRRALIWAAVILATIAVRDPSFRESLRYTLQSVGIAYVLVYVVNAPKSVAGSLLNLRPVVWFGRLSYAFYLVHFVVIYELAKHFSTLPTAVLALVVSTGLSVLLQRTVERPGIALRQRFTESERRHARAATTPTPTPAPTETTPPLT